MSTPNHPSHVSTSHVSTGSKTPKPMNTPTYPSPKSQGLKTPKPNNTPAHHSMKLKSAKVEADNYVYNPSMAVEEYRRGRPSFKRSKVTKGSPSSPVPMVPIRLFSSPTGDSVSANETSPWVEVVEISDDEGVGEEATIDGRQEHENVYVKTGLPNVGGGNVTAELQLKGFLKEIEESTENLINDIEKIVCSMGNLIEATIGICKQFREV